MTKLSRPQDRATWGEQQHSPILHLLAPPAQAFCPSRDNPRSQGLSMSHEPEPGGAPVSQPPSRGRQLPRPLSSTSVTQQPQLVALRPTTSQESEGRPRPSLWPPTSAGAQLELGRKSTSRPQALGHQMPALGRSCTPNCTFRGLEALGSGTAPPRSPPLALLTGCTCWESLWESPWMGSPWGTPFPGSLCSAP